MPPPRESFWLYLSCVLALSVAASANAQTSLWQPYRSAAADAVGVPTQYLVDAESANSGDVLTDADLNQLAIEGYVGCCDSPHPSSPPFVDHTVTQATRGGFFQLLPSDVIWHSYWAGAKESRTSATAFEEFSDDVSLLDVSLGGRTAVMRNATRDQRGLWNGWELQIEGAAILRLNLDQDWDFDSADFRFGVPLILARDFVHYKLAYYHLSSHVGDEFLVRNPGFTRINFSRDVLVAGASYFPIPAARLYGEVGYAFYDDEGSDPWEFQFGLDVARAGPTGSRGTPFFAFNGHLREEVHFGGNFALQTGWLWRGQTGRVIRTGLHYYNGKSPQFEFFDTFEQQLGIGLWQEY